MNTSLKQAIQNSITIGEAELEFMLSLFKPLFLKKEALFLEVGKVCNYVAFVNSGLLRIFYINSKGEETTCYFSLPNEFVTSISSFTAQIPTTENIQAIQATELFIISKHDLDLLYHTVPVTQEFGRKAAEKLAMIMEQRISLFLNHSADERYKLLLESNPALILTVPLQYLASYLGISPQHLSRLRKNI